MDKCRPRVNAPRGEGSNSSAAHHQRKESRMESEPEYRSIRVRSHLYRGLGDYCYQSNQNLSKTLEELIENYLREQGWQSGEVGHAISSTK